MRSFGTIIIVTQNLRKYTATSIFILLVLSTTQTMSTYCQNKQLPSSEVVLAYAFLFSIYKKKIVFVIFIAVQFFSLSTRRKDTSSLHMQTWVTKLKHTTKCLKSLNCHIHLIDKIMSLVAIKTSNILLTLSVGDSFN